MILEGLSTEAAIATAMNAEQLNQILSAWLIGVLQDWDKEWSDKPETRYGKDVSAFVGDRLLSDARLKNAPELIAAESKARSIATDTWRHGADGKGWLR